MRDFLEYLIKNIVDDAEAVVIDESEDEYGNVLLTVTVSPEDIGKVIGKEGRIIKAVRDLVKILAVKAQRKVNVVLNG
jgi:hypothetical protein